MAKTLYGVSYQGLLAVYPSYSGLVDPRTLQPEVGGGMNLGDYFDLTEAEAQSLSPNLHAGRYRFVRIATAATAANIFQGAPVGFAKGTQVGQVAVAAVGSGMTAGTYSVNSTTSGGTAVAVAQVVVGSGGTITSASILSKGAGFTSVPTFDLTALGGSGGSVLAQMDLSPNVVTSFDASAVSLFSVRGVFLAAVTAAQITAGAYVFIQEEGIATVLVSTATSTAAGAIAAASSPSNVATVTTTTGATLVPAALGTTLDLAAASTLVRVELNLPIRQG